MKRLTIVLSLFLVTVFLIAPGVPAAPVETVTNLNDSGPGSLRQAIADVDVGGTINIAVTGTIVLGGTQLLIAKDLTINGPGADVLAISANFMSRVFGITAGTVSINDVTIRDGAEGSGGGVYNAGTLTLTNVTVTGNRTTGGNGGGIRNDAGTVTVMHSTISGNVAAPGGAGGGIANEDGTATVTNSTVSGNRAGAGGGGIVNDGGSLTLTNSTISGNRAAAGAGGGIFDTGTVELLNTIVANSPSGDDCVSVGTVNDNGNNLVEDGTCGFPVSGDPLLGPLADNGGPTQTHALLPGSPAVDAGSNTGIPSTHLVPTDDQRGFARPQDGDGNGSRIVDMGAFEARRTTAANEPGSLLVYPLIDNINGVTIVNIANLGTADVNVECYSVTHGPGGGIDQKNDFVITLTPKEKFVWLSSRPYNQRGNQIAALADRKGYLFCWAIDNVHDQCEAPYDYLKGDATFVNPANARAFNYNAIAHQTGVAFEKDKVLKLDGSDYTAGSSQILFEGLAEVPGVIGGTLVVANPGIDFVESEQPEFDINLYCWNEVESKFSRHLKYKDFEQYDLTQDLQLDIASIFTLGFQCATTSTHALWAVFQQDLATIFGWGGNVWQHPDAHVPTTVVLPECNDTDGDGLCDCADICPDTDGRYSDRGDGTVLDCNTGLYWLKDASCADLPGTLADGQANWSAANAAAAALADGTCGLTDGSSAGDWRLPTAAEFCSAWSGSNLFPCPASAAPDSLINRNFTIPTVSDTAGTAQWSPGDPFVGVQSGDYWSATEGSPSGAWGAGLYVGGVGFGVKASVGFVWPVRVGQ